MQSETIFKQTIMKKDSNTHTHTRSSGKHRQKCFTFSSHKMNCHCTAIFCKPRQDEHKLLLSLRSTVYFNSLAEQLFVVFRFFCLFLRGKKMFLNYPYHCKVLQEWLESSFSEGKTYIVSHRGLLRTAF